MTINKSICNFKDGNKDLEKKNRNRLWKIKIICKVIFGLNWKNDNVVNQKWIIKSIIIWKSLKM